MTCTGGLLWSGEGLVALSLMEGINKRSDEQSPRLDPLSSHLRQPNTRLESIGFWFAISRGICFSHGGWMSGNPIDVSSWRLVDPALMLARLRIERFRPKVGTWIIHKGISPLDLYVYLRARFGAPNGFAMTLKHPSNDNLIHWNWTLQSGPSVIELLGYQVQVIATIDHTDDPSSEAVAELVAKIKADFSNHGPKMADVRKSLEKWIVFTNPYWRLRRVVDDISKRLQELNIDHKTLPGLPKSPEELETFGEQWVEHQTAYTQALGYGLSLRMISPVLAESFVNLVILLLTREDLKTEDRLYRNVLRQEVDVRVKTLHINCVGFFKKVDSEDKRYKAFHTLMNGRNDFLHGSIDPLQLKYETVYFEGTIPLFTEFKDLSQLSLVKSLAHVEPETALKDAAVANDFVTLVIEAMDQDTRKIVKSLMSIPDPGWSKDKNRAGILFSPAVYHTVIGPRSANES